MGHIQATGLDARGRKQYRYHDRWRERRDREKFEEMVDFARALPQLRKRVTQDMRRRKLSRERVLACAVRLLDRGLLPHRLRGLRRGERDLRHRDDARKHVTVEGDE